MEFIAFSVPAGERKGRYPQFEHCNRTIPSPRGSQGKHMIINTRKQNISYDSSPPMLIFFVLGLVMMGVSTNRLCPNPMLKTERVNWRYGKLKLGGNRYIRHGNTIGAREKRLNKYSKQFLSPEVGRKIHSLTPKKTQRYASHRGSKSSYLNERSSEQGGERTILRRQVFSFSSWGYYL